MSALVFNNTQVQFEQTNNITKIKIQSEESDLNFEKGSSIFVVDPSTQNSPKFLGKGYINNIQKKDLPSSFIKKRNELIAIPQFEYIISSTSFKEFYSYVYLEDYSYSLEKVYRYQAPILHFRRAYTLLDENDANTLQNEWIYVSRTVFGRLLNALPRINKLDFITQIINEFETDDLKKISYLNGLKYLKEYIEERVLTRGKYIVQSRDIIKSNLNKIISDTQDIGFILKNESQVSLIKQANLFDKVFELQDTFIKVKEKLAYVEKQKPEAMEHFYKIFENTTWPIDLNRNE